MVFRSDDTCIRRQVVARQLAQLSIAYFSLGSWHHRVLSGSQRVSRTLSTRPLMRGDEGDEGRDEDREGAGTEPGGAAYNILAARVSLVIFDLLFDHGLDSRCFAIALGVASIRVPEVIANPFRTQSRLNLVHA